MGTPMYAYDYRTDNKLYRIRTPQSPLVRPKLYDVYNVDEYPLGTNAIVAVISYTVSRFIVVRVRFQESAIQFDSPSEGSIFDLDS